MTDFPALIAKLEAWKRYDFHKDRQLADEVLIADGWRCEPDAAWGGGVRWFRPAHNPEVSVCEDQRPNLIHDMNTALAVVPYKYNVCLILIEGEATATVWEPGNRVGHEGKSALGTIAVLIAALKATQAMKEVA